MHKIPLQPALERPETMAMPSAMPAAPIVARVPVTDVPVVRPDWRSGLPLLTNARLMLRELRREDAPALMTVLGGQAGARFISAPPKSIAGFERFIEWGRRGRANGEYACFAVVLKGQMTPVGLFQVRAVEPGFGVAEWGFVLCSSVWGTGVFTEAAQLVVDFAFDVLGVHRLEARAVVSNGRGNGALRKMGAVQEGILRRAFERGGEYHDQMLWSILAEDWRFRRLGTNTIVH